MGIYAIRIARTKKELAEVFALRHDIFVLEQGIPAEKDKDGKDDESIHYGVFDEEITESIGTARLTPGGDGKAVISRIGVKKEHRGRGLAKRIIGVLEYNAFVSGIRYVTLRPHAYLEDFYKEIGYQRIEGQDGKVGDYALVTMEKYLKDT